MVGVAAYATSGMGNQPPAVHAPKSPSPSASPEPSLEPQPQPATAGGGAGQRGGGGKLCGRYVKAGWESEVAVHSQGSNGIELKGTPKGHEQKAIDSLNKLGFRGFHRNEGQQLVDGVWKSNQPIDKAADGNTSDLMLYNGKGQLINYDIYTPETANGKNAYSTGLVVKGKQARGIVIDMHLADSLTVSSIAYSSAFELYRNLQKNSPNIVDVIFIDCK